MCFLIKEEISQAFRFCCNNRVDELSRMIEKGFPVNTMDENGNMLLHVATQQGLKRMCKVYIFLLFYYK